VYDAKGVSCTLASNAGGVGAKTGLYCVGNINPSGKGMNGNVYSSEGLVPTVTTNKGEGSKIFIDQSNTKTQLTDVSRCITSRYTGGIVNRSAMNSAVLEAYPILTPNREEKRQNGRRMKNSNEPMFTLTGQDRHGVAIKEATKKGYVEANVGDGIYLNFPNSTTRRGRVGKGIVGTLDTGCQVGTLDSNYRIRRLTPRECFRLQGFPDELFEEAQAVNSDAQLYKQAGNAVTVNVALAIAEKIRESEIV
jgi:DNA (cytosine-5)-methyltransferase 1